MLNSTQSITGPVDTSQSRYTQLKTITIANISLNGGFWSTKQLVNRKVSLRHGFEMLEKAGNFHNLRLAAGLTKGEYRGRNFLDSDVYKWLEAVAWELGNYPNDELQKMADETIDLIAAAQRLDGYVNSYYQVAEPESRWKDLDHGHEMYCAGHLFQAAIAFQRAIGDKRLMDIARRFADHIGSIFGPKKRHGSCGHPEVEMSLIELYRCTGERSYLELAKFFIDQRGQGKMVGLGPYGPEYHQDHLPIRDIKGAVGHTVRQLYLAAGVTDLYLETGEQALLDAMLRLSNDIFTTKLYITGGLGSRFDGEAFGDPYELPADQCYCEACSSIASLMWNWRMLLATGESRFADQMELAVYNTILASPALDGSHFFYINPLMLRDAKYLRLSANPPPSGELVPDERPEWHTVACCPPNVMRLLASIAHYLATTDENGIQIHHFASSNITCKLSKEKRIGLQMTTEYPWQGSVNLQVTESAGSSWTIALRLPEWCQTATLKVNAQVIDNPRIKKGYLVLERAWKTGDVIELDMAMKPMLVASNPRIDATRASLAIQQGPVVYCLEDCDQDVKGSLLDIEVEKGEHLKTVWRDDLLGGINLIELPGKLVNTEPWEGKLYQPVESLKKLDVKPVQLFAIPYYAWGNRGIGPMRVWIPMA